jgi:hypothetical protein
MEIAYESMSLSTSVQVQNSQLDDLLRKYYIVYLFENNLTNGLEFVLKAERWMEEVAPGWSDTEMWLRDERQSNSYMEQSQINPFLPRQFAFHDLMTVSEAVGDTYGQYQNLECRQLRSDLLAFEYRGSGRIKLSDFYGFALRGDWRFSETIDFLRTLGALDETNAQDPSVIVTNYIYGKSMCVGASSYYDLCCIDECNHLLERLELEFQAPEVDASRLAAAIANLPSSTVAAPRNLSAGLVKRLHDIAAPGGFKVPIHGRLFSQFMHHAYPRECPFPHVSGTTQPQTQEEWVEQHGRGSYLADNVTLLEYGRNSSVVEAEFDGDAAAADKAWELDEQDQDALWDDTEELLAPSRPHTRHARSSTSWIVCLAMVGAIGSFLASLRRNIDAASDALVLANGGRSMGHKHQHHDAAKMLV